MNQSTAISAARTAALAGDFDRSPAYAGLADALMVAIGDGRIPFGARLPSERELTETLGVSRTTVARAYAALRDGGYAEARQGSGTFTRAPGGRNRARDRALVPQPGDQDAIDLGCAAASAPPGLMAAYTEATADLPAYLGGHGYYPTGLPQLQEVIARDYARRGLPTDPDQILVTTGALSAAAVVAQALTTTGDRVAVETPVYPNATRAVRSAGARLVPSPVDPEGWDLDAVGSMLTRTRPRLAYLIPDFQNPTGHLMSEADRVAYAGHLRRAGTVAVVDEAHQALGLDLDEMPRPFGCFAPDSIALGSASKSFWGGLRLGWIRAPRARIESLTRARIGLDVGAPVLEQLVLARLLAEGPVLPGHRERMREQRDALLGSLEEQLPEWTWHRPRGGLAVWCRLPAGSATALAEAAEERGVLVTPGPVFAVEGGLDRFVRLPWTRPTAELTESVRRLAEAWAVVRARSPEPVGHAAGHGTGQSTGHPTDRGGRPRGKDPRRVLVA